MILNNEVYENVQSLAQKAKHGSIRVADYNRYANLASMDLFNERIGSVRDLYKLGKAMDKTTPGMNKEVDQAIRPFLVAGLSIPVTANKATLPSDCECIDSVMFGNKAIKWVPYNKISSYLNSTIDIPTVDYPIFTELSTELLVYPSAMSPVLLTYYRTPATVVWNYTLVDNRPVYNATGTVNFEFFPTEKLQLIMRILNYIGITIRDSELLQYGITETNIVS